jgi:hypothetical protein
MYKKIMAVLAVVVLILLPSYAAGKVMGVTYSGETVGIDETTGAGSTIGATGFSYLNSLAKNQAGTLYSASGNKLITINSVTGVGTQVATLNFGDKPSDVRGLAFSPQNVLYAVINDYPTGGINPDYLYTVDIATGVATLVGATGLNYVQSLTFSASGVLYGWDISRGLLTINTATGTATVVNPGVGALPDIQGIAFAADGTLYGAREALYTINPATSGCTLVGSGGYSDVRGIEVLAVLPTTLIGVSWSGTNSPVVKIDKDTGIGTTIGLSGFSGLNSLAKNQAGTLYSASGNKLITINPTTGAGTQVATLNFGEKPSDVRGLAFSPQNVLYAVINDYGPGGIGPHYLYTVDVGTGVATLVGETGPRVQSITFSAAGALYGWDIAEGLLTINTSTGAATVVNPGVGALPDIQGIVFAPDGTLYGAREALYTIDTATSGCTLVGSGGYSDVRGIEFVPVSPPTTLIGASWSGTNSPVVKIDRNTGAGTVIGLSGFPVLNSLAKNQVGTVYSASGNKLITINLLTGAGTQVATLNFGEKPSDVRGLAFSPKDVLYAVINDDGPGGIGPDYLYTVNVTSGVATLVGATGLTGVQSLTFSASGILYGWDIGKGLLTINTGTGAATVVNPAPGSIPNIQGIAFAPDGTLYGAREGLYTINPATSGCTLVGSGGYSDVRGIEFVPFVYKKIKNSTPILLLLLGD